MEFGYLCVLLLFSFCFWQIHFVWSRFSRLVFFRLASLRSMVLRRRSFDTATQTLFAVSLCSCCLFHRRRCTSTLGAWFARVVVWFAREGHVCLSGRRNGVFGMDCWLVAAGVVRCVARVLHASVPGLLFTAGFSVLLSVCFCIFLVLFTVCHCNGLKFTWASWWLES